MRVIQHPSVRCLLLLCAMQIISAYKFRCWIFCTEQTAIQNDYIEQRDICRRYAQLRIETDTSNAELLDERARTNKLVTLFSACMAEKGWTIPEAKQQPAAPIPIQNSAAPPIASAAITPSNTPAAATTPSTAQAPMNPAAPPTNTPSATASTNDQNTAAALAAQRRNKAFLARSSECAFARHSAAYSSVAAARAKACDLECSQRMRDAPDAPRPAACPAGGESSGK